MTYLQSTPCCSTSYPLVHGTLLTDYEDQLEGRRSYVQCSDWLHSRKGNKRVQWSGMSYECMYWYTMQQRCTRVACTLPTQDTHPGQLKVHPQVVLPTIVYVCTYIYAYEWDWTKYIMTCFDCNFNTCTIWYQKGEVTCVHKNVNSNVYRV